MGFFRKAKKTAGKAVKAVGKRYGVSYGRRGVKMGTQSIAKMARDLALVKKSLNVEKKFVDTLEEGAGSVGQVNDNFSGQSVVEITPFITQGVAESQRVGNSIKATGMVIKFSMIKQESAAGPRRMKIFIVRSLDPSLNANDIYGKLLDFNQFSGLKDYHSNLDYTQLKDGRMKIIAQRNVYMSEDSQDAITNPTSERQTKALTIALKFNEVLRFASNSDAQPENVRYHMVMVADNGNKGFATSALVGIYVPQAQSGINYKMSTRMWYVDN